MKKITITLLSLIASASFAQTTLLDFESGSGVSFDFGFGFLSVVDSRNDTPSFEANPSVDATNGSARVRQLNITGQTEGGNGGYGVELNTSFDLSPTTPFLTVLMRSDQNNIGVQILTAAGETNNTPRHSGFAFYTGNGDWQLIETALTAENGGTGTAYTRAQFNLSSLPGLADYSLFIDDIVISDVSLSTGDFAKDGVSVYPIPATLAVNIRGDISGDSVDIYDVSGSLVGSAAITGDFNSVDVSALAKGVYFMRLENGSVLKFVK